MSILSCLELVGHHMEADVPAAANISLQVKSFLASLRQAIILSCWVGESVIKNEKDDMDKSEDMHQNLFGQIKIYEFILYRAATRVEEPISIFPTEKIPLGELLASCHLGFK